MMRRSVRSAVIVLIVASLASVACAEHVAVSGTVVTPDGALAEGATVTLWYVPSEMALEPEMLRQTTGPDGAWAFEFETDAHRRWQSVVATLEGYSLASARAEPGEACRLQLGLWPVACEGQVVGEAGEPITGARVEVVFLQPPEDSPQVSMIAWEGFSPLAAETDEQGRFAIEGLPAGSTVGLWVAAEGWATHRDSRIEERRSADLPALIVLQPEARISGRVTRDGEPVAGIVVMAARLERAGVYGRGHATTDAEGRYALRGLPPGEYRVSAMSPEDAVALPVEGIELQPGDHREGVELQLVFGAAIEGTVTMAETGKPVPGVTIWAVGPLSWGTTDENGRYRVHVPPGKARVYWAGDPKLPGLRSEPRHHVLDAPQGEVVTGADFVLAEPPGFPGRVVDADGEQVADASVWLIASTRPYGPETTDAEGRFALRDPRLGGDYVVWAEKGDLVGFAPSRGPAEETRIVVRPGAWVVTEVRDTEGNPVEGVALEAWAGSPLGVPAAMEAPPGPAAVFAPPVAAARAPHQWPSDADGQLRIGPLPAETDLELRVARENYGIIADEEWLRGVELWLAPGERRVEPLVVDPDGRTLPGVVLDGEARPVAGAWVISPHGIDDSAVVARSDGEGRFALEGLRVMSLWGDTTVGVLAVAPDGSGAYAMPSDPGAGPATFELEPPGAARGVVRDGEGRAVPGVELRVSSRELRLRGAVPGGFVDRAEVVTAEDGSWRVEGLVAGLQYTVRTHDRRYRGSADFLLTIGGQTAEVDLVVEARDDDAVLPPVAE